MRLALALLCVASPALASTANVCRTPGIANGDTGRPLPIRAGFEFVQIKNGEFVYGVEVRKTVTIPAAAKCASAEISGDEKLKVGDVLRFSGVGRSPDVTATVTRR